MQRISRICLVLCAIAISVGATAPAFARHGQLPAKASARAPGTIAELQPGDRRMSCAALSSEIGDMSDIIAYGKPQRADSKSKGVFGTLKRVGGKVARSQVVHTVASLAGPLGGLAANVIEGRHADSENALKLSARARHDRLITLYDRKSCA